MSAVAPERVNVSLLLDHNLEAGRGDKPALIGEHGTLTLRGRRAPDRPSAGALRELGVGREDRVLMVLDDSPAFHAIFLGRDPDRRRARPGEPDGPSGQLRVLPRRQLRDGARRRGRAAAAARASARRASRGARARRQRRRGGAHELRRGRGGAERRAGAPADTHPDDMAFWLYSSGSTGRPKGVVHTAARHRRDDRHLRAARAADHRGRPLLLDDEALPRLRPGQRALVPALGRRGRRAGQRAVAPGPRARDGRRCAGRRCSSPCPRCTPRCSRRPPREADFASVRACVSAAEPLPAAVSERWQRADRRADPRRHRLDRDAAHLLLQHARRTCARARPGSPVPGYELRVVDEDGQEVGPEEPGDLLVRGESCAAYYWHQRRRRASACAETGSSPATATSGRPTATSSSRAAPTT